MSFHKVKTDSIPQGWVATPLSDLVVTKAGNSKLIKGKMHHEPARYLFQGYSASGADVWSDSFEYDADGVVVSAVGARCGKSFLAKGKWVAVANTHVVLPFEDAIDPEFLWYGINDEDFWIKSGTAQPFVVVSKSFERLFAIPPRAEQTRIVAKLEELLSDLDAGVAELKAAQKKLAQYRQSLLKAAVEGALTAEWRAKNTPSETGAQLLQRILTERRARWEAKQLAKFKEQGKTPPKDWQKKYPEPVQPNSTDLPKLPEGWVWASVEQLAELVSGHTPKDAATVSTQDGVVPWFKVGDMNQPGNEVWMSSATVRFSREIAESLGMKIMPAGTIIFPKRGGAIATNKKRKLGVDACYDLNTMGLVPVKTISDWLWTWFMGVDLGRLVDGAIIPQINNPDIAPLCVPIPPSSEQREIISVVNQQIEAVGNQANAVELSLKQSSAQRQNILRAAFAGELVPQDPNDEPASVLLERIRAERAAQATVKKQRGRKSFTPG